MKPFAILLCICLLLAALPGTAFAVGKTDEEGLVLDKWVEQNGDDFKLVLESYATGEDGTVEQRQLPVDVVLVLDESGSMADTLIYGCDDPEKEDVEVRPEGHLADGVTVKDPDQLLFVGHKVMAKDVDVEKTYMIVYPGDGNTREIHYCETCDGWFSNKEHDAHKEGKLAKWIPFQTEDETPTNNKATQREWTCHVQFYEECTGGKTGKQVLQEAVGDFLTSLYKASKPETGAQVHNRVAVVGYGEGASYISPEGTRSQLFQGQNNTLVGKADQLAKKAFRDVTTFGSEDDFTGWIDGIHDTGSTPTHLGIQAAQMALENVPDDGVQREKVVILFTDGAPGSGYINYGPGEGDHPDWVTPGIKAAKEMKDDGVTVYCVGLFPSADGYGAEDISYDVTKNGQGTPGFFENANCFLHLVSSNYPNATGIQKGKWGALSGEYSEASGKEHSYYLGTENADDLSEVFSQLSTVLNPGSTTVKLTDTAVVRDVVTDDFQIKYTGETADVTAYTMSYQGEDADGTKLWKKDEESVSTVDDVNDDSKLHITVGGQTVSVTNFDFAGNYVHKDGDEAKGKKLVVEIEIKAADDSLGGVKLPTNTGRPGVYDSPESPRPVEDFPLPHVDLPTTVTVQKEVVGGSGTEEFSFEAAFTVDGSYEDLPAEKVSDSNYLHLENGKEKQEKFKLKNGGSYKLEKVEAGYDLTVRETGTDGWYTTVRATTRNGATTELQPDADGNYKVTVTPGMVITFTNTAYYTLKVEKVNREDEPLSGAEFQLQKLTDAENDEWTAVGDNQTTAADGVVTWSNLLPGDYQVVEINPPKGYVKIGKPYAVTIPADGSEDTTIEVKITNGKVPQTGGVGALRCTAAALAIFGGAAVVILISRRKKCRG